MGPASPTGAPWVVQLTALDGRELAHASVGAPPPVVTGGPAGAYWFANGHLMRLDVRGQVTALGEAHGDSLAISPDGTQWAYSVMAPSSSENSGWLNQLWVGGTTHAPRMIASRTESSDPSAPVPADAPAAQWVYRVLGWNERGIIITRMLTGVCGCGPFADERFNGHAALVDPMTGVSTTVTNDEQCPVSGIADDGTDACFESKVGSPGATALRISRGGVLLADYSLSGVDRAGAALFEPTGGLLAYSTVNASLDPGPALASTALRILDLRTGEARAVGPAGLIPVAWLPDGTLIAQRSVSQSNGDLMTSAVHLDPATGHVTAVTSAANLSIVGAATR